MLGPTLYPNLQMITLNLSYVSKDKYLLSGRIEIQTPIWMTSETLLLISVMTPANINSAKTEIH